MCDLHIRVFVLHCQLILQHNRTAAQTGVSAVEHSADAQICVHKVVYDLLLE